MSYTQEIKKGLLALPIKRACCKKMWLLGLLSSAVSEDEHVRLRFHTRAVAESVSEMLKPMIRGSVEFREFHVGRNEYIDLLITDERILEMLDAYTKGNPNEFAVPVCSSCMNHYAVGAFLSCGTVNAPEERSHLEFRIPPNRATFFTDKLTEMGFTPGVVDRRGVKGVYLKSNQQIEDMMGMMGDTRHALEYLNSKVIKQAKSEDHRITNYEIGNLQKAIDASMKDIRAIECVKNAGKFGSLPEETQYSANLRLEHPEATLRELAHMHTPSVSVSGLCHRMKAIKTLAEEVGEKQ